VALLLAARPALADYVRSFESEIVLLQDGSIEVTDRILVDVLGDPDAGRFARPLWRLPDRWGDVEIIEVLRDGEPENWRLLPNRILTSADTEPLGRGDYLYRIKFRVPNAIEHSPSVDQLIWFTVGDSPLMAYGSAAVTFVLPEGAPLLSAGYDVRTPEMQPIEATIDGAGRRVVSFRIVANSGEPLRYVAALNFAPGYFVAPSPFAAIVWRYLRGNPINGMAAMLIVIAYFVIYWVLGFPRRRPRPSSDPLSPADVRFLLRGRFDATGFLAAILSLVAKGHAHIRQLATGTTSIEPAFDRRQGTSLSDDEAALYKSFFGKGETGLSLTGHADQRLIDSAFALRAQVDKRCMRHTSLDRRSWLTGGYVLGVLGTLLVGGTSAMAAYGLHVAAAFATWTTLFVLLVWLDIALLRALVRGERGLTIIAAIPAPFVTAYLLYHSTKWFPVALDQLGIAGPGPILLSLALILVSSIVLRSRLDFDRSRRQQIATLRDRLASYKAGVAGDHAAPRITARDPFLPYAIALGVPHPGFEAIVDSTRRLSETSADILAWRGGDSLDGQIPNWGVVVDLSPPR